MAALDSKAWLENLANHVFLPPVLPGHDDEGENKWESQLISILHNSLVQFGSFEWPISDLVNSAISAVQGFRILSLSNHAISPANLAMMLNKLKTKNAVIPMYIRPQNAGIIVRSVGEHVIFETFELAPTNEAVFATNGRLRRQFPATTVSLTQNTLNRGGFCKAISTLIADMSTKSVPEMQPQIVKAGESQDEDRDTVVPHIITELLVATLSPFGELLPGRQLWKNTREEVRYAFGNTLPWRRSPVWLLMRVMLQLTLAEESSTSSQSDQLYKKFMVYFMAQILKLSLEANLSSDAIYFMNAKIARRIHKLGIEHTEQWMLPVRDIMRDATARLGIRWQAVLERRAKFLELPDRFQPSLDLDCKILLSKLESFLDQIRKRTTNTKAGTYIPSSRIIPMSKSTMPSPSEGKTGEYTIYNLVSFEDWVAKSLQSWIKDHLYSEDACKGIYLTIKEYFEIAAHTYKSMPEGQSIMLLTILELWVACDKSATAIHPLLLDYDPEVPVKISSSLLLRFRSHMKRLSDVETYIQERRQNKKRSSPSIFTTFGTSYTFAARFCDSSAHHTSLLARIETRAREMQEEKRQEFRKLKIQHDNLLAEADVLEHQTVMTTNKHGNEYLKHPKSCQKCRLVEQAAAMTLEVYEWPLPWSQEEAKSVVFELDPPLAFNKWRDCTYFLRKYILGPGMNLDSPAKPLYSAPLVNYQGLASFIAKAGGLGAQIVTLASKTKSNAVTHRSGKNVARSTEHDVCLGHGMAWRMFDQQEDVYLEGIRLDYRIAEACTFVVPSALQPFLRRHWDKPDGPDPNLVIASQSSCPDNLSLEEFKALCSLPLGHKVIWENILREFAMPSVDWRKVETALFVWQASHQAGPALHDSELRASHKGLEDEALVQKALDLMTKSLNLLKENWESVPAMVTFATTTARLLSLTSGTTVQLCLELLSSCRQTCFSWLQALREKLVSAGDTAQLQSLTRRILQTALACIQTFDLDDIHLERLLRNSEALSTFIQCCIVVYESFEKHEKSGTIADASFLDSLVMRYRRLLFRTKNIAMEGVILHGNLGLDFAIQRIWPAYRRTQRGIWVEQAACWLRTTSSNQDGTATVEVHYNLITAELLVNGIPLSRLPSEYEAHADYSLLFGQSLVQVMPTAEAGMHFSTRSTVRGYQVHLSYDYQEQDLLVRACLGNTIWELVPSRFLQGRFPQNFVENFVHWYDVKNQVVDFRPNSKPWTHDDSTWTLRKDGSHWVLRQAGNILVNPCSKTALCLSNVFLSLEGPSAMHVVFDSVADSLLIEIPRLQLQFYIQAGSNDIMSQKYRGMRVDPDQTIGTLIGLVAKLVLVKVGDSQNRLVLIPDWAPEFHDSRDGDHINVSIPFSATRVQTYQMNHHLHCLTGNGSLKSKLFLVELHALTSGLIEDPFTHHTGTEEALNILRSEGVRSFDCLSQDEIDSLARIAKLSPLRKFYPEHLKSMQVVVWASKELSIFSQHVDFIRFVRKLFDQASRRSFLYKDFIPPPQLDRSCQALEDREAIRSSVFYRAGYGAESYTMAHDAVYAKTRDTGRDSNRALRVTKVAAAFNESDIQLPFPTFQSTPKAIYERLSGSLVRCPSKSQREILSFDAKWLSTHWPTLRETWGGIQTKLGSSVPNDRFSLLPWMATLAFAKDTSESMLSILMGLIFRPELRVMDFPSHQGLQLDEGYQADLTWIQNCIKSHFIAFEQSGRNDQEDVRDGESRKKAFKRRKLRYENEQAGFARDFAQHAFQQGLNVNSGPPDSRWSKNYVRISKALDKIKARSRSWSNNRLFLQSLERLCASLRLLPLQPTFVIPAVQSLCPPNPRSVSRYFTIQDLISLSGALDIPQTGFDITPPDIVAQAKSSSGQHLVSALGSRIATIAKLPQETRYVEKLMESINQLSQNIQQSYVTMNGEELKKVLSDYYQTCLEGHNEVLNRLKVALSCSALDENNTSSRHIAEGSVVWPSVSPRVILALMNRSNWAHLSEEWRKAVTGFGCCLTQLQGAERLLQLHGQETDLVKELTNLGQRTWDPIQHPDSLLLEVEGNLRIRKVQQEIAEIMECPPAGESKNAVMQLNMGEGKSSVIVPVVAAALGNGSNLVRIIVGKPQSRQMFEMLVSKLGGLIGRRVYHMPFSRDIRPDSNQAAFLESHYNECRLQGGVLLLQPENIISFQLMVLESAIKDQSELSELLMRTQVNFFDKYSRDIVDESDENFSVKFELIYTMGMQGPIDFAPDRWAVVLQVLGLVSKYALTLSPQYPKSIEVYKSSQGRYPRVRFLDKEACGQVLRLVADHVCENGLLPGFPVSRLSKASRDEIREYISKQRPRPEVVANVQGGHFWATASGSLLLIRGLFAGGILDFVFSKKRWRVNYGLDMMREPKTSLAVPYRAKDIPSQRSEFSQPEVVIALTSISYYYGGLTDEELFLSFLHLLKSDQPEGEYQSWVHSIPNLPAAFRQLGGVNITDKQLCIDRLFPLLRYAKGVIDYFLSKIVFVKEMKEFPHKLSASGWDLGRIKTLPATGFSGTNDSQHVLPLMVKQLDLPTQVHTNALVLENLLRPENSVVVLSEQEGHSSIWSALQLLQLTVRMEPETRVILDVGAQIIDLSNQDVAKAWLDLVQEKQDIQAVVFCNDDDELSVLDRQGQVERLQTSPFAKHLDACLVFLDEAHTRGIDLRLPQHYRAAVTLGANLVKDRLVQACMRMRKLGHGQSVVFYIPEEIETKIRRLDDINQEGFKKEPIAVLDVLAWSISETWADIRRSFPIWATQGSTFARQQEHWESMSRPDGQPEINKSLAEKFLEDEAQTLERRYRPHSVGLNFIDKMAQSQNQMLQQIYQRYCDFSHIDISGSSLQEEQERELAPEVEEECQKERAEPAEALPHRIDPDVQHFVRTGLIRPNSVSFQAAFSLFGDTTAGNEFEVYRWPEGLLITKDFAITVKPEMSSGTSYMDDFLRSIQWILTSSASGPLTMVVISPYEANKLRDDIASSQAVIRHLYGPRQNQGFEPIDTLDLYTLPGSIPRHNIPRNLVIELNLFAGQLYFRSFEEYKQVCDYLGLAWKAAEEGQEIMPDGFIQRLPDDETCGFKTSPVKFLKVALSTIRFNCQGIEKTHLGRILEGALLTEDDFVEDL